ncbi:MAG: response regulator transcription factor [Sedimentisphaerales bacterium]|nr:response regulator transcription factor [Sedimentisphaerales bacterium]
MSSAQKKHIFIVDDDNDIRKVLRSHLEREGYRTLVFSNAAECLESLSTDHCSVLICDVKLPDKNGLELLQEIRKDRPGLPIIMITVYGDVPMAVKALQYGANDFIEKPLDIHPLLHLISSMLRSPDNDSRRKGEALTRTEAQILEHILDGRSNRGIAQIMHRSIRTIEDHRRNIMRKMDAKNVVDLVRKAINA